MKTRQLPSMLPARPRPRSGLARTALLAAALLVATIPAAAHAQQVVVGGDFDIADNLGSVVGNRVHLTGRVGFGTNRGTFVLVNAADAANDVDHDGYTPGVDFQNLAITDTSDFVNEANPAVSILRRNLVISDFLNPLRNGINNVVNFYVNVPNGTPAGRYLGRFTIVDRVLQPGLNANGEALRTDYIEVEIEVLPQSAIGLVQGDTAAALDSLVLRGRAGQTVNGVFRVANLGNVELQNVRFDVTDLIATSGTGLRIRRERISFTPAQLTSIAFGDTSRATVTVRIPTGLLAGSYTGEIIVQGEGVAGRRIPLTVIVTTPGDIIFETNPVLSRNGDRAVAIFNADPGTGWSLAIFDMMGLTTYRTTGTVFSADQAVRVTWPLQNGKGEDVAGGMYLVIINVTQDGKRRQLRGKLMVIR